MKTNLGTPGLPRPPTMTKDGWNAFLRTSDPFLPASRRDTHSCGKGGLEGVSSATRVTVWLHDPEASRALPSVVPTLVPTPPSNLPVPLDLTTPC